MLQNRYFQFIFICLLGVFTFACIDNAEALKNAKKTILNISETNDKFKRQLNTLTANYYNLSDAIANENMEEIRKSAYATISNIRQIPFINRLIERFSIRKHIIHRIYIGCIPII